MDAFYHAAAQLPTDLSRPLRQIDAGQAARVTEIRLRSGRPVALSTPEGPRFLRPDGTLTRQPEAGAVSTPHALLQNCFRAICGYSMHTFSDCIAHGFVPMPGGHRAGVCGTAYVDGEGAFTLKNITSINVRIARAGQCVCDARLLPLLHAPRVGLIVAGEPGSGKTTLLRAVMEELSRAGRKTAVVDERFELAPVEADGFSAVPPLHCDILSGYPRAVGMQHALRALAPDVLLCDEVGTEQDAAAVGLAANAGVGLVVTIHAQRQEGLRRRPQYQALLQTGAFSEVAFLAGRQTPGKIAEVLHVEADS